MKAISGILYGQFCLLNCCHAKEFELHIYNSAHEYDTTLCSWRPDLVTEDADDIQSFTNNPRTINQFKSYTIQVKYRAPQAHTKIRL